MDNDYNANDIEAPRLDAFGLSIWAPSVLSLLPSTSNSWLWDYTLLLCTTCQKIQAMPLQDCK